jgi:hypothetical protein
MLHHIRGYRMLLQGRGLCNASGLVRVEEDWVDLRLRWCKVRHHIRFPITVDGSQVKIP